MIAAALAAWSGAPAQWGRDDCALAIANIDRLVLGTDTAAAWRGRYRSARGARRLLGRGGVQGMAAQVAEQFGWRAVAPAKAQDGDRGTGLTPGGITCLIRYGGFWVGRCDRGNWLVTDAQMIEAWSIL